MSLPSPTIHSVPAETARVAHQVFPKGNRYLVLRDQLGAIYEDADFATVYSSYGQSGICPWRLALVCVLQFLEDLPDRQAADAVRSRIDWKYALGLELSDPGFDFSVLSEFRSRLIEGHLEQRLLDRLLEQCKQQGWIKARGQQRTDSTHVLAAIRLLNRGETIGEMMRAALNALATVAPEWLQSWVPDDWFKRYSRPVEETRLPKGKAKRQAYCEQVGRDGMELLERIWADVGLEYLRQVPMVERLRQLWVHQFWSDEGTLRLREAKQLPPAGLHIDSPYEPDARYGNKRSKTWTGYKAHLTETCEPDQMHLITDVITTPAHVVDITQTTVVHANLKAKHLLPAQHFVDGGYIGADLVVTSRKRHDIELIGPLQVNGSWQAKDPEAYDLSQFQINWRTHRVTCPQGKKSTMWGKTEDVYGHPLVFAKFSRPDCRACPGRSHCTRSKTEARSLVFRPRAAHEALHAARKRQQTDEWRQLYHQRAGIEGTISQAVATTDMRHNRYIGLAKTHLQHVLSSVALNIARITAWLMGRTHAPTRTSRFAALATNLA